MSRVLHVAILGWVVWGSILTGSARAEVWRPESVYLTVGFAAEFPLSEGWKQARCNSLRHALSGGEVMVCDRSQSPQDLVRAKASGRFKYHLSVVRERDGQLLVGMENWHPEGDLDFRGPVSVRLAPPPQDGSDYYLRLQAKRLESAIRFRENWIANAVAQVSDQSKAIAFDPKSQEFSDRSTGRRLDPSEATARFAREDAPSERPKHIHFLRQIIETGMILGVGAGFYYSRFSDINQVDYDFQASAPNQWSKLALGHGVRFDSNPFSINMLHPAVGTLYYSTCRANGMNRLEATGCASAPFWMSTGTSLKCVRTRWESSLRSRGLIRP